MSYGLIIYLVLAVIVNILKRLAEEGKSQSSQLAPMTRPAGGQPDPVVQNVGFTTKSTFDESSRVITEEEEDDFKFDHSKTRYARPASRKAPVLSPQQVKQGILLSEVLGPPRALRPWKFGR